MPKSVDKKSILHVGVLLAISALIGTGVMAITYNHAKDYIEENNRQVLIRSLSSVLVEGDYNNNIIEDKIIVTSQQYLGSKKPLTIYRARHDNQPVAAVLTTVAPNGYNGPIKLIIGIQYSGEIIGVRVVKHRETPGLGDGIEAERSDWVFSFNQRSLDNTGKKQWQVKKDGGVIDQLTGATITPRAIVKAVHLGLRYYRENRDTIFRHAEKRFDELKTATTS
jgi:Na+-translocating ferredoxin:NAD+ oxidoreductase subunit G